MFSRLIGLMILGTVFVSPLAQANEIYRWTDEQGRVTYGDSVPDRYKRIARKVEIGFDAVDMQGVTGAAGQKPQTTSPATPPSATGSGRPSK